MIELHLFNSASGAGGLMPVRRHARVVFTGDDYALGPLEDAGARAAFWKALIANDAPTVSLRPDLSLWTRLLQQVKRGGAHRIFIWNAGDPADHVLLRKACRMLPEALHQLWEVPVPPRHGLWSAGAWTGAQLGRMMRGAARLSGSQRARLAAEFDAMALRTEPLRACDAFGRLRFLPLEAYDDSLMLACHREWRSAAGIISDAWDTQGRNQINEIFAHARLRQLVVDGRLEAQGDAQHSARHQLRLTIAG